MRQALPTPMSMRTTTSRGETLAPSELLRLMCWLSPAFPVGGYTYSHGIEAAVEDGLVTDRAQVEAWIGAILAKGSVWLDAGLFLAAHRAVWDQGDLREVVVWGQALRGTAEMALESASQGRAFLVALRASWPDHGLDPWLDALSPAPPYAVAVAAAAALAGIDESFALCAYLQAVAANLVSAAVRLVPLGQTDGQRVIAGLVGVIPSLVERARALPFESFGSASLTVDWTSMKHETQYTRLFRS